MARDANESIGEGGRGAAITNYRPAISLTPTPKDQLGKFAEGCLAVLKDREMYLAGKHSGEPPPDAKETRP